MFIKYPQLKLRLFKAGMSQTALAKEIGVSQSTVSSWIAGKRPMTVEWLVRVLHATGASAGEIAAMSLGDILGDNWTDFIQPQEE